MKGQRKKDKNDEYKQWTTKAVTVSKIQGVDIGPKFNLYKRSPFSEHSLYQGSPNQAKWATSLPWFQ
jgi:hypothetical protein